MGQASQARWSNDDDDDEDEEIITIGQVCLIGDSVGSILSYDALCRKVFNVHFYGVSFRMSECLMIILMKKAVKEENKKNYRRCGEQVRGAAEMPTICAARSPLTSWRTIWLPPPSGRTTTRSSLR